MMKRLAVLVALVPMLASANDLTPGTFELTGDSNLGFTSGSEKVKGGTTTDTTDYNLNATGLYYVIPNLGIGLNFGYSHNGREVGGNDVGSLSTLMIGPAISYELPVAPQFAVFGRGTIGYASSTFTQAGAPDDKFTGWGFGLEAGVKYFIVKAVSLDAGLGYTWANVKDDQTPKTELTTSAFGLNVGLSVYFGGAGH